MTTFAQKMGQKNIHFVHFPSKKIQSICILLTAFLISNTVGQTNMSKSTFEDPKIVWQLESDDKSNEKELPMDQQHLKGSGSEESEWSMDSTFLRRFRSLPDDALGLSRAFGRLHFVPLLRLRPISSRAASRQSTSPDLPNTRKKKAFSFFSRFYPFQQSHGGSASMTSYAPRRRVSFNSGYGDSYPSTRYNRPIMRLRWGK